MIGVITQGEALEADVLKRMNQIFDDIEEHYDTFDQMLNTTETSLENIVADLTSPEAELPLTMDVADSILESHTQFAEQQNNLIVSYYEQELTTLTFFALQETYKH